MNEKRLTWIRSTWTFSLFFFREWFEKTNIVHLQLATEDHNHTIQRDKMQQFWLSDLFKFDAVAFFEKSLTTFSNECIISTYIPSRSSLNRQCDLNNFFFESNLWRMALMPILENDWSLANQIWLPNRPYFPMNPILNSNNQRLNTFFVEFND